MESTTYKFQVLLTMDVAFEGTPMEDPESFFTDHYCVDNLLKRALEEQEERFVAEHGPKAVGGYCNCFRATVKYLGIVT